MQEVDIRYTVPADEPYLKEWIADPNIAKFFPMETPKETDDAIRCWTAYSKYSASLTATINGIPCGIVTLFLMPYRKVAHHCIFKVIVDPKHHRQGIGTQLIRNIKHLAKNYFRLEILFVDVFEHNPLIELLKTQGFNLYGAEKRAIKQGSERILKILMECPL